jgi:two-component system sensor histidine kinase/response regulator
MAILVIDDSFDFRASLSILLERSGFQSLEADDGEVGIQLAQQNIIEAILCDMTMPDMSGMDVYHALQQSEKTAHIPFIFLTGMMRTDVPEGATYLQKPLKLDVLLQTLERVIRP